MVFEALNESGCLVVGFLDHGENFSEMLKKMKWEETAKHLRATSAGKYEMNLLLALLILKFRDIKDRGGFKIDKN